VQLLEKAERWQRLLDAGKVVNRAALAHHERTSTSRVTQVLRLLDLPEDLLSAVRALPAGTPARLVTERELRRPHTAAVLDAAMERCLAWSALLARTALR